MATPSEAYGSACLAADALFMASCEAVLIVDRSTELIIEANPAAALLLCAERPSLTGMALMDAFEASSLPGLRRSSVNAVGREAQAESASVRALRGGIRLRATLSLFKASPHTYLLIRLDEDLGVVAGDGRDKSPSAVIDAIESASVGFVVTDAAFLVEYANLAFASMAGLDSQPETRGQPLTRWLQFSPTDHSRLRDQMFERRASTMLSTTLKSQRSAPRRAEVCAIAVPNDRAPCWGFTIRELPLLN